jgi:hypothetical protein
LSHLEIENFGQNIDVVVVMMICPTRPDQTRPPSGYHLHLGIMLTIAIDLTLGITLKWTRAAQEVSSWNFLK